jgi:hypothetical protein
MTLAVMLILVTGLPLLLAQTANRVIINQVQTSDAQESLNLEVYFTVTDSAGVVVPLPGIGGARIILDDGTSYNAVVTQPTTPLYISLILDASGSMSRARDDMVSAAASAVQNAPDNAMISLAKFNEQFTTLSVFTDDRNRIINTLGEVQPVDLNGTCLYDAVYAALENMSEQPEGRRAIVLFTDGRDEKLDGTLCSSRSYDEVVDLAGTSEYRSPIHIVGLRGSTGTPINENELRALADATGGLSAFGSQADLESLFDRISSALISQWLATAEVYPESGDRILTLVVTLANNQQLEADVASFTSPRSYVQSPEVVKTTTVIPDVITVESVALTEDGRSLEVRSVFTGSSTIEEYRVALVNASSGLLVGGERSFPAPMPNPFIVPATSLGDGEYSVRINGVTGLGNVVVRSDEFRFRITRPTATPAPPTNTPVPVGVTLNNISFDEPDSTLTLGLTVRSADQIGSVRVEFVNADTNALVREYSPPVVSFQGGQLVLPAEISSGRYIIRIVSMAQDGQETSRTEIPYEHVTATPTPTPTATPTETPVLASAEIVAVEESGGPVSYLVVRLAVTNEELIRRYELDFVDRSTNLVRDTYRFEVPPYDRLRILLSEIQGGEYNLRLRVIGESNAEIAQSSVEIAYAEPTPTPTPAPTQTPAPTPTPEPEAPLTTARRFLQENMVLVLPIVIALAIGLVVLMVALIRRSTRPKTGTGFLAGLTGAQEAVQEEVVYQPSQGGYDPDATNPELVGWDPDATNPFAQSLLPPASLTVHKSRAAGVEGKTIPVNHVPFTLGRKGQNRKGCDINFDGDDNVSRQHANINYRDGAFYITDLGSTHGTFVDGFKLEPNTQTRLNAGSNITLGTTTKMTFNLQAPDDN